MIEIKVNRAYFTDCTLSRIKLFRDSKELVFSCFGLELPWRGNQQNVSCIIEGEYEAYLRDSPKNGSVIELKNVPNRSYVQFHSGNFLDHTQGCILVGDAIMDINKDGIPDVANSQNTMRNLLKICAQDNDLKATFLDASLKW